MHFQSDTKVGFATCARWRQRRRDLPANDHGPDNKTVWKNIQSEADTAENLNQYFAHVKGMSELREYLMSKAIYLLSLSLSLSLSPPPSPSPILQRHISHDTGVSI